MTHFKRLAAAFCLVLAGTSAQAATIMWGTPQHANNSIWASYVESQEAVPANLFTGLGSINITGLTFFASNQAQFTPGATWDLNIGTVANAIANWSMNTAANLPSPTLFSSQTDATLNPNIGNGWTTTFTGNYLYDSALGDLVFATTTAPLSVGGPAFFFFTNEPLAAGQYPGGAATGFGIQVMITYDEVETPEPATLALMGAGLAGLGLLRRRRA